MHTILRNIFSYNKSVRKMHSATCYYSQPETPLPEICSFLQKLGSGSVDLVQDDTTGIATLCLNQPEKRNAISGKMMVELLKAVETLEGWSVGKGMLLYGKGGNFCSGGDLNVVRDIASPDDGFKMSTLMQNVLHRLHTLPLVTVALVEGAGALGGGAEIAISCDYRLFAGESTGIGFVHGRMGIAPAWGGGVHLVKVAGRRRGLDLLLTARVIKAPEALDIGLADGVVDQVNAMEEALNWLKAKTSLDVQLVRAAKMIVSNASDENDEKLLEVERRIFAPLWGGPINKEALSRYFKKSGASKTADVTVRS